MHGRKHCTQGEYECLFPEIFGAEKELIWRLAHILVQKEALKRWAIQYLIVLNNRINRSLAHTGVKKLLCSKIFGAEQHRQRFTLAHGCHTVHYALLCIGFFDFSVQCPKPFLFIKYTNHGKTPIHILNRHKMFFLMIPDSKMNNKGIRFYEHK